MSQGLRRVRDFASFAAILLVTTLAGCGDGSARPDDGGMGDGSVDGGSDGGDGGGGGDGTVTPPEAPAEPTPPAIAPCPDGWREVTDDEGVASCEAWPEGGRAECGADAAHLPGAEGCARVGTACPSDGFPADAPDDALFVEQGASGGTGTRGSPFGTVTEALSAASAGDVIAIAAGRYEEELSVTEPVTLLGACTAETLLTSSSTSESDGVVRVDSDGVVLENLRVGDSARPGVWVSGAGLDVTLRDVVVAEATAVGIWASRGAELVGETLVVRDTRNQPSGGLGWGINAQDGATVTVQGGAIAENGEQGVVAIAEGTTVRLEDVALRDTRPAASDGMLGRGVAVFEGADVELVRSVVEGNTEVAVLAFDAGTEVRLERSVVRDTQPHPDGLFGYAVISELDARVEAVRTVFERNNEWALQAAESGTIRLEDAIVRDTRPIPTTENKGYATNLLTGATFEAERVEFSNNAEIGVFVSDTGTSALLTDVVIRDTQPRDSDGARGRGLAVQLGATAEVRRALIERNAQYGVFVGDEGSGATLEDVLVRETRSDPTAIGLGLGLTVQGGATASVTRGRFVDNRKAGVYATRPGSELTLTDVHIEGTEPGDGSGGRGLLVQQGATAQATRVAVVGNTEIGVFVATPDSSLRAEDLLVRETRPVESTGTGGRGINVQGGASLELVRGLFERNREVQIHLIGEGTTATVSDVVVRESLARACDPDCADGPAGIGVGCYNTAECDVEGFVVAQAELCGLQLAFDGSLDLREGEVSNSPIGVCLQQEGYDVSRLSEGVRYRMNEVNIDTVELPVPQEAAGPDLDP